VSEGRGPLRTAGWVLLAVVLWAAALPAAWLLLEGLAILLPGAPGAALVDAVVSHLRLGPLQLLAALPAIVVASRRTTAHRGSAVAIALVVGTLGGYLLVAGFGDPVTQVVVVAWVGFGIAVPRPPGALRLASPDRPAERSDAAGPPGPPA
jgi:hypothetical protein